MMSSNNNDNGESGKEEPRRTNPDGDAVDTPTAEDGGAPVQLLSDDGIDDGGHSDEQKSRHPLTEGVSPQQGGHPNYSLAKQAPAHLSAAAASASQAQLSNLGALPRADAKRLVAAAASATPGSLPRPLHLNLPVRLSKTGGVASAVGNASGAPSKSPQLYAAAMPTRTNVPPPGYQHWYSANTAKRPVNYRPQPTAMTGKHPALPLPRPHPGLIHPSGVNFAPTTPAAARVAHATAKAPLSAAATKKPPPRSSTTPLPPTTAVKKAASFPSTTPLSSASKPHATSTSITKYASALPAGAPKHPPKRGTPSANHATPTPDSRAFSHPDNPLIDPKVVPAVHSIIALLQTYGPLSYEQLKFNMLPQLVPLHPVALQPPKPGELKNQLTQQQKLKKQPVQKWARKRDRLQKVLDILQELGVIHLVDRNKLKAGGGGRDSARGGKKNALPNQENDKKESSTDTINATKPWVEDDPNPIYCYGNGTPRMDVVLPSQILHEIQEAGQEVLRMKQRIEILKKALHVADADGGAPQPTSKGKAGTAAAGAATATPVGKLPLAKDKRKGLTTNKQKQAHNILTELFERHPEIARDPVYAAALRLFRVDVGVALERHHMSADNGPEMEKVINAGINFNAGRFGAFRKRSVSMSFGGGGGGWGGGAGGAGGEGGVKKKRKKGRPPKNANNNGGVSAEFQAVRTSASWA